MVLQWPIDGAEEATSSMNSLVVDLALGEVGRACQTTVPEPGALAVVPAVQHRAAGEHDRRNVDGRRRHEQAGVVLSQPVVSTTPSSG